MPKALLLVLAFACTTLGLACFAASMRDHQRQFFRERTAPVGILRAAGTAALTLSFVLCFSADHATMAPLVWVMSLATGALVVAFALAWKRAA